VTQALAGPLWKNSALGPVHGSLPPRFSRQLRGWIYGSAPALFTRQIICAVSAELI